MSKKNNNSNGAETPTDNKIGTDSTESETPTENKGDNVPARNKRLDRLIPLKSWNNYHDWPPPGGLRHIRTKRVKKNASHVFIKKGGLILVREKEFWEWADTADAS
jgi:hypothetical protein